jgi:hypothetical protein
MKITAVLLLILFLVGCQSAAVYNYKRCVFAENANGDTILSKTGEPFTACSEASVESDRELKDGVLIEFNPATKSIRIQAGSVTTGANQSAEFGFKVADKLLDKLGDEL